MASIQSKMTTDQPVDELRNDISALPDLSNLTDKSDQQLLASFQNNRDAAAFTVLVERHRAMIFGVSRRMLGCSHAAEDVVQATFLVFANSANKIRKRHSLVSWLYGVAYRISARSARQRAKLSVSTLKDEVMVTADPLEKLNAQFEQNAVFEELHRLSDDLRTPMVLRYLNGKSNLQVADEMNLSESAVEGRLKRGRKQLRLRLARKGVSFGIAVGVLAMVQNDAAATQMTTLTSNSMSAASLAEQALSGGGVETGISSEIIRLADEEILKMATMKLAGYAVIASVAIGIVASGWALAGDSLSSKSGQGLAGTEVVLNSTNDRSKKSSQETTTTLTQQNEGGTKNPEDVLSPFAENVGRSAVQPSVDRSSANRRKAIGHHSVEELSANELAIYEALKNSATFEFNEAPLTDVVAYVADSYGIQTIVDEQAINDEGFALDSDLITFAVENVRLDNAMQLMLDKHRLAAIVTNEVMILTSKSRAEEMLRTRIYQISSSWNVSEEDLREMIHTAVQPGSWEENGGTGTMYVMAEGLVISANHFVHTEINELLSQLDRLYPAD